MAVKFATVANSRGSPSLEGLTPHEAEFFKESTLPFRPKANGRSGYSIQIRSPSWMKDWPFPVA